MDLLPHTRHHPKCWRSHFFLGEKTKAQQSGNLLKFTQLLQTSALSISLYFKKQKFELPLWSIHIAKCETSISIQAQLDKTGHLMSQDLATEVLSASLPNSLSARSVHLQLRIISDSQILSWLKKKKTNTILYLQKTNQASGRHVRSLQIKDNHHLL